MPLEFESSPDKHRYSSDDRDAILKLAARLQDQHRDTASSDDLETLAEEVGIDRRFVREAVRQMSRDESKSATSAAPVARTEQRDPVQIAMIGAGVACLSGLLAAGLLSGPLIVLAFAAAVVACFLLGTHATNRWLAAALGGLVGFGTVLGCVAATPGAPGFPVEAFVSAVVIGSVFGWCGRILADQRKDNQAAQAPHQGPMPAPSQQSALVGKKVGVLSAELAEMDPSGSHRAEFQQRVRELAEDYSGQIQSSRGDSIVLVFPTPTAALRAARALVGRRTQDGTMLPIRCGLSHGMVQIDGGAPLSTAQGSTIDLAVARKAACPITAVAFGDELAALGLNEFGSAQSIGDGNVRVYVWRAL
jgi:hypothetical protein